MKRYIIMVVACIGLLICSVLALSYYYSNIVTLHVGEYSVSLECLNYPDGSTIPRYSIAIFKATVLFAGSPLQGIQVDLLKNGAVIGSNTTEADGTCTFQYNATDPVSSSLQFQARASIP